METLKDFVEKDMLEQIKILEQIVMDNDVGAVTPLLELYGSHECDQAVEEVVYHTLQQLMQGHDGAVMQGLKHPATDIQLLAMRCGCESGSVHFQTYLVEKLQNTTDPVLLAEIIRSMSTFADPELITVLLPYMHHVDTGVAGSCIDLLASLGGDRARDGLIELVEREMVHLADLGGCSFVAALSMECLARFADETTIAFLLTHIHHDSPTFRRLVNESLIAIGVDVIGALIGCVQNGTVDEKIMAVNSIGFIRHRKGAELLIAELDAPYATDINIRFAMYEAIGRVDCLRSALCLADALATESHELVVNAVLMGLERICHPGLAKVFSDLASDKFWVQSMVQKLLSLRSKNILQVIYAIPAYRQTLLHDLAHRNDTRLHRFCLLLFKGATPVFPEALDDLVDVDVEPLPFSGKRIVVVDDSKAIIRFYCQAVSEVGFDVVSAYDGQEAMDFFRQEKGRDTIDLLLTDMNMPNKDGIELVREVRQMDCYRDLPILMASTESESLQREVALAAGVSDFISKPFTREVLVERLAQMLQ